jgi:hypothetical protein
LRGDIEELIEAAVARAVAASGIREELAAIRLALNLPPPAPPEDPRFARMANEILAKLDAKPVPKPKPKPKRRR